MAGKRHRGVIGGLIVSIALSVLTAIKPHILDIQAILTRIGETVSNIQTVYYANILFGLTAVAITLSKLLSYARNRQESGDSARLSATLFIAVWMFIWLSWAVFYHLLSQGRQDAADMINIINSTFFICLFLILDNKFADKNISIYVKVLYMLLLVSTAALVCVLYNDIAPKLVNQADTKEIVLSFYLAVSMMMMFGRLDSHILAIPRYRLIILYCYAAWQMLYPLAVSTATTQEVKIALFAVATAFKVALFLIVSKVVFNDDIYRYIVEINNRIRRNEGALEFMPRTNDVSNV